VAAVPGSLAHKRHLEDLFLDRLELLLVVPYVDRVSERQVCGDDFANKPANQVGRQALGLYVHHALQPPFVVEKRAHDLADRRSGVLRFYRQVQHGLSVDDIFELVLGQVQVVVRVVLVCGITDSHDYHDELFGVVDTVSDACEKKHYSQVFVLPETDGERAEQSAGKAREENTVRSGRDKVPDDRRGSGRAAVGALARAVAAVDHDFEVREGRGDGDDEAHEQDGAGGGLAVGREVKADEREDTERVDCGDELGDDTAALDHAEPHRARGRGEERQEHDGRVALEAPVESEARGKDDCALRGAECQGRLEAEPRPDELLARKDDQCRRPPDSGTGFRHERYSRFHKAVFAKFVLQEAGHTQSVPVPDRFIWQLHPKKFFARSGTVK